MTFLELAKKRHSCRDFCSKKVEKEKLDAILEAAQVAPTTINKQPHKLIVVQEASGLVKLAKTAEIYNAPLAIIVCGDAEAAWTRSFDEKNVIDIDITVVTDYMMLAATDIGLNSLWVSYFDPEVLKKEFNIPAHYCVLHVLALGYSKGAEPSLNPRAKKRKPLDSFVFYEKMNNVIN